MQLQTPARPRTLRLALGIAAALATLLPACRPAQAEISATAATAPIGTLVGPTDQGVVWAELGVLGAATLALSPLVEVADGALVRIWTLNVLRPGTPQPLGCLQGFQPAGTSDPIRLERSAFFVEVQPRPPLTWAEVFTRDDLVGVAQGIH